MDARRRVLLRVAVAALTAAACQATPTVPPAPRSGEGFEVREGRRLFGAFCAPCHGETGGGDGAYLSAGAPAVPPDFAAEGLRERLRTDALRARLASREASGETHCPPWGHTFAPAEIEALAVFLERLAQSPPGTERPEPAPSP